MPFSRTIDRRKEQGLSPDPDAAHELDYVGFPRGRLRSTP
jgi:hypothetical protein